MEGEEEAAPRCACGTCSGLQPKSRHAVPLHKPFEVGKRTPKDKYDVKLADRLSFMCFRMPASAGQPGGWLPLSRRSREEIINCSSGLVHQVLFIRARKGGWAGVQESSLLSSKKVMEWRPVLSRFSAHSGCLRSS